MSDMYKKETPTFWVGVGPKILFLEWLVEMPGIAPRSSSVNYVYSFTSLESFFINLQNI
jgi:hypothetical protein